MKSFEELDCWKISRDLRISISKITKEFPNEEKYRLIDQMKRASRSVTSNIAEGFGKFYLKDNVRFCRNSKGSLYELMDHFIVAHEESYISEETLNRKKSEINRCLQVLNGYINYLSRMNGER